MHKLPKIEKTMKALVITLSDRASKGIYEDKSGPLVKEFLEAYFRENDLSYEIQTEIIPDMKSDLSKLIFKAVQNKVDYIFTTGGTGIGKKDITVDTVQPMLDKEIPGIMEHIRLKYGSAKPNALLSRGVAGVLEDSIIYTLPGSVKAVKEYMTEIVKTMHHLYFMLHGIDVH